MDVNTSEVTIGDAIGRALKSHLQAPAWQGLLSQVENLAIDPNPSLVARVFTSLPRQLKSDSTIVRLARVWVLTHLPKHEEAEYVQLIERLFKYGDMEELVALYSALQVFHYPEAWLLRCKEGIRSNIGPVRHAVMVNNPYPARFLDEEAWNQLVLKAFFTDEDIPHIIGLKPRNNLRLAQALTDYAYERHAAQREINPMLWILVGPFMDDRAFELMERIVTESHAPLEQQAIVYAFTHSGYGPALQYLKENDVPDSFSEYRGTLWETWESDTGETKEINQ
ncbi:EboA domain-containing protein [Parapedobacter sp. 10938]|uniref:EboA domain-containing protein n=1 Tax=Parapedobacter flavus TaxID=3110225 RepID=UPI002DBE7756|nr:EboA domain-containing protein [Parapedobacter sp. 10938]MEC3880474.1 EboA domain-containing protein [Parapedobacter sp. 10938]